MADAMLLVTVSFLSRGIALCSKTPSYSSQSSVAQSSRSCTVWSCEIDCWPPIRIWVSSSPGGGLVVEFNQHSSTPLEGIGSTWERNVPFWIRCRLNMYLLNL